jgi:hypothetical protein
MGDESEVMLDDGLSEVDLREFNDATQSGSRFAVLVATG